MVEDIKLQIFDNIPCAAGYSHSLFAAIGILFTFSSNMTEKTHLHALSGALLLKSSGEFHSDSI